MIVGLHGKMGAGKNEAAKRLALLSPLPVKEVSFAAKLKESAAAVLGCTVDDLETWKNEPWFEVAVGREVENDDYFLPAIKQTVRSFLQRYGTEAHRDVFGQDFWLDAALPIHSTGVAAYDDALYVVTDVRFENEAKRVRDLGGFVVRIIGPNEETGSHASERPLQCDTQIDNSARDDDYRLLDTGVRWILECCDRLAMGEAA